MVLNLLKALGLGILIWIVGFVWGSIVFMTPALKATPMIPYVSANPAISFPILLVWIPLTYLFARVCLWRSPNPTAEGLRIGIMFAAANFVLDLLMLVWLLRAGFGYFRGSQDGHCKKRSLDGHRAIIFERTTWHTHITN
jgi:predicted acyltransferase